MILTILNLDSLKLQFMKFIPSKFIFPILILLKSLSVTQNKTFINITSALELKIVNSFRILEINDKW